MSSEDIKILHSVISASMYSVTVKFERTLDLPYADFLPANKE
jgi:hypothetical protein